MRGDTVKNKELEVYSYEDLQAQAEKSNYDLFYQVFQGLAEGLLLWNDDYQIIDLNPAGEKITGLKKEEVFKKSLKQLLEQMNQRKKDINKEIVLTDSDNSKGILTLQIDGSQDICIEYTTKRHIFKNIHLTVFRDVTEREQLLEKLQKSDTLSVVGQLAAGIAHEIRNPLTALKGFIQLVENSSKTENRLYFDVIKNELDRIDSIINELLILAKPKNRLYTWKNIVSLVEETIDLLKPQAMLHNIQFSLKKDNDIPEIFCEPYQLKKVFINIIKNAIEVMPNGGYISIKIEKNCEKEISISITDEGKGIPESQLKSLGQPFFTTKEKGTGLGLMVSYQIIKEHHGTIEVKSIVDKGTTFKINLPIRVEN